METQKIALFGATSKVGQRILNEALARGHQVTAIVRDPKRIAASHPNLKVVQGDIFNFNKNDVTSNIRGHDVVISTYKTKASPHDHVHAIRTLIEGVKGADIKQLITFGHPGSEEIEAGVTLPGNAEGWKEVAQAQSEAIESLKKEKGFRWGYAHFPEIEGPLGKNGKPSLSNEMTLATPEGDEKFTFAYCAEKVLDEAEHQLEEHSDL